MSSHQKDPQPVFQRWQMTSFGDERPSAVAQREAEQRLQDAETARRAAEQRAQEELALRLEQQESEQLDMGPPAPPPPSFPTVEELEEIREQARQEGYADGQAAGHEAALAEGKLRADAALAELQTLASSFASAVQDADQLIANDVLELALQLAKRMLKTALPVKPELLLPVVREAIDYLPALHQPAQLLLHPEDAAVVREGIGEELEQGGWRIVEDAQVGRGGCKVETASNQIDATAAARWQRLSHALAKDISWLD